MSKVFAVLFETASDHGDFAARHPDQSQRQRAWFVQTANDGKLLACGPLAAPDGAGLWLIRAANREEAESIVRTSPRFQDGTLSLDRARIVEWAVSIGKERFNRDPE
jgi:uncharacterized protein YciI